MSPALATALDRWQRFGFRAQAGLLHRAPWAELLTWDWPVMHILLTHVGMSQSLRGKGLTQ